MFRTIALLMAVVGGAVASAADVTWNGTLPGDGWILLSWTHDGSSRFTATAEAGRAGSRLGAHLLDQQGVAFANASFTSDDGGVFASIDLGADEPREVDVDPFGTPDMPLDLAIAGPPFTGYVLVWAAGDIRSVSIAANAAAVFEKGRGLGSFYSSGEGFDSEEGHTEVRVQSVSYVSQRNATYDFDVAGRFIGVIRAGGSIEEEVVSLETPDAWLPCYCRFTSMEGANALGPGAMTIHRSIEYAGREFRSTLLAGVDVAWPQS